MLYNNQGRSGEAEPLYQRALAIREKAFGPEHPDVPHLYSPSVGTGWYRRSINIFLQS
jgi:Tetratricopeptide repeat